MRLFFALLAMVIGYRPALRYAKTADAAQAVEILRFARTMDVGMILAVMRGKEKKKRFTSKKTEKRFPLQWEPFHLLKGEVQSV